MASGGALPTGRQVEVPAREIGGATNYPTARFDGCGEEECMAQGHTACDAVSHHATPLPLSYDDVRLAGS